MLVHRYVVLKVQPNSRN